MLNQKILHTHVNNVLRAPYLSDGEAVIHYTHPAIIQNAGGAEKIIAMTHKISSNLEPLKMRVMDIKVGPPQDYIKTTERDFFWVMAQTQIKQNNTDMFTKRILICVKEADGKLYFLDNTTISIEKFRELFPGLPRITRLPLQTEARQTEVKEQKRQDAVKKMIQAQRNNSSHPPQG